MVYKFLLLFIIIFFLTLMLSIIKSRRRLWLSDASRNSRLFTLRGIAVLIIIILFLFFSLFR